MEVNIDIERIIFLRLELQVNDYENSQIFLANFSILVLHLIGRSYSIPRFCSFNVIINNLACGDEHSAFIASNGYIYTMGSNVDGKLGIASRNIKHSASPCLVEVLSRYKAVKVSCG